MVCHPCGRFHFLPEGSSLVDGCIIMNGTTPLMTIIQKTKTLPPQHSPTKPTLPPFCIYHTMNLLLLLTLLSSVFYAPATSTATASHDTTTLVNSHKMRQQATNGIISTVAGKEDDFGYSGDGGAATAAELFDPMALAIDATGSYFIGDFTNDVVRKVTTSTGIISTVAGVKGQDGFSGDGGPATSASFSDIRGLAVDANGNLYIADSSNNRIRKVILSSGIVSTVAGTGVSADTGDGGAATAATLSNPTDVAVDVPGNVYIADSANGKIRKITISTGIITTVAGGGQGVLDNIPATSAIFTLPSGIAFDIIGNMYILVTSPNPDLTTTSEELIKKISVSTGIITTIAGRGTVETASGIAASTAALTNPTKIAVEIGRAHV